MPDVSDVVWAAEQRRQNIAACTLCDADGYIGCLVCDHEDHRPVAVRGRQLITRTLQNPKEERNA